MTLLEEIESRLAVCAKATPGTKPKFMELKRFLDSSRNQREGELAALKVAVEALKKPYICCVCGDRSEEKCGRVCDGDESSCCKYVLNFAQALAQIASLLGPQDKLLSGDSKDRGEGK